MLWFGDRIPDSSLERTPVDVTLKGVDFKEPVYVDPLTGKVYRLDMSRVVIHGQSAGAHLAMLEAFRHPEGIRLIINEYGPADLITMQKDQPAVGIVSRKIRRTESPVEWVRPGLPRMAIYHGDADELVPFSQTEELIDRLEAADVPFELNVIEGADHGFMNQTQEVRDEIAARICGEIAEALGV